MLPSAIRNSYRLVSLWRKGAVCGPVTEVHRVLSTSVSFSLPESSSPLRVEGRGAVYGEEKVGTSLDKWKIDPLTGKKILGSNWNYSAELFALASRVGVESVHLPFLQVALRDKSVVGAAPSSKSQRLQEHSRLSVLGQSVLQHYVHEYLYFNYPKLAGDMLKDISNFLTSEAQLTDLSHHLGVTQLIQTRKLLNDPKNSLVVTDAFCAVIGVLYEKQGAKSARSFVHDFVISQLANKDLSELIKLQHPRFMLNAILKSKGRPRLVSRLITESGRATHFPSFVVGVYSGDQLLGEGCGTSLKRAEREAMVTALQTHFQTELSKAPLPSDHEDFVPEELLYTEVESKENSDEGSPAQ